MAPGELRGVLRQVKGLCDVPSHHFRFLLYIEDENQVFLLDRDNTVFKPDTLTFPWGRDHLYNTLLDGVRASDGCFSFFCHFIVIFFSLARRW